MAVKKTVARNANKGVPAMAGKKRKVEHSKVDEDKKDKEIKLQESVIEKIRSVAEFDNSDEGDNSEEDDDDNAMVVDEEFEGGSDDDDEEVGLTDQKATKTSNRKTKSATVAKQPPRRSTKRKNVPSEMDEEEEDDESDDTSQQNSKGKIAKGKNAPKQPRMTLKQLEALAAEDSDEEEVDEDDEEADDDDEEADDSEFEDEEDDEDMDDPPEEMSSKVEQTKGERSQNKRKTLLGEGKDAAPTTNAKKTKLASSSEDDEDDDLVLPAKSVTKTPDTKMVTDGKQIDEKLDQLFNTYRTTPEEVEQFKKNYLKMVSSWLFIPHVPDDCTDDEILALHSKISKVKLPRKRKEGKNFAFLNFVSKEDADEVLRDFTKSPPTIRDEELKVQHSRATGITPPEYINRRKLTIIACPKETTQEELCRMFPQATTVWLSKNPRSDTIENYLMFPDEATCKEVLKDNGTITIHGKCCAIFYDNYTYKKKTASRKLKKKFDSGKHVTVDRISIDAPKRGGRGRGSFRGRGSSREDRGRGTFRQGGNFSHEGRERGGYKERNDRENGSFREEGFRGGRGGFRGGQRGSFRGDRTGSGEGFRGNQRGGRGGFRGGRGGFRGGRGGRGGSRGGRGSGNFRGGQSRRD